MAGNRPEALKPGHELGGYRIESVLGKGGFGITYRAIALDSNTPVALKECCPLDAAVRQGHTLVPAPGQEADFEDSKRRFYNEARLLYELDPHEAVVRVTHLFEKHGTYYFAMDYINGVMLVDYIRNAAVTDDSVLRHIFMRMLDALEHLHERGVLHRDICPRNIMIRAEDGEPMLIDFGAARVVAAGGSSKLTAIGKVHYGAIEQFIAVGKQGPWTDLHALGASLYELTFFKALPSVFHRYGELMDRKPDPRPEIDHSTVRQLPQNLLRAMEWSTRFFPHDRPQTTAALREVIAGDAISAIHDDIGVSKTWGKAPDLRTVLEESRTRAEVAEVEKNAQDDEVALKPFVAEANGDEERTVKVVNEDGHRYVDAEKIDRQMTVASGDEEATKHARGERTVSKAPDDQPDPSPIEPASKKDVRGSKVWGTIRVAVVVIASLVIGYLIAFFFGN